MAQPLYLMWFDDNPKISVLKKIEEAIEAYTQRFQTSPNVVLLNERESGLLEQDNTPVMQPVRVRSESFVRRNNFWVGIEHERDAA